MNSSKSCISITSQLSVTMNLLYYFHHIPGSRRTSSMNSNQLFKWETQPEENKQHFLNFWKTQILRMQTGLLILMLKFTRVMLLNKITLLHPQISTIIGFRFRLVLKITHLLLWGRILLKSNCSNLRMKDSKLISIWHRWELQWKYLIRLSKGIPHSLKNLFQ